MTIRIGKIEELERIYPSYELEFPVEERKTIHQLKALMEKGEYLFLIAEDLIEGEWAQVGFSFVYTPKSEDFMWLDYIVIERLYQSRGYGSKFYKSILAFMETKQIMYIEVEIPTGADINQDRRIKYYERLGAEKLPVFYMLPTPNAYMPMHLYVAKRKSDLSLLASDIQRAIQKSLSYIHYDHPDLASVLSKIKFE